jgi:hypothetical protein
MMAALQDTMVEGLCTIKGALQDPMGEGLCDMMAALQDTTGMCEGWHSRKLPGSGGLQGRQPQKACLQVLS